MFENKTRKLILENTNQFISDQLILGEISRIIQFQTDIEYFLDTPVNQIKLENVETVTEDLKFHRLCSMMGKMDHPYVIYKDMVLSPWDVCLTLLREDLTVTPEGYRERKMCPHCGKEIS